MNNLIGISGKTGSGVEDVAGIIQYLSTPKGSNDFTLNDYLNDKSSYLYAGDNYQIKKFSDKIKDIVCILIGCTREQLNNDVFLNTELGEEWNWWRVASKDGSRDVYVSSNKEDCIDVWRNINKQVTEVRNDVKLTPRKLLELITTDCGEKIIHPSIWINSLFVDYKYTFDYVNAIEDGKAPFWIITDVKHPNQVKAIKDREGIVIRVYSSTVESIGANFHFEKQGFKKHESGTTLNSANFDYTINNNGDIEDLINQVKQLNIV